MFWPASQPFRLLAENSRGPLSEKSNIFPSPGCCKHSFTPSLYATRGHNLAMQNSRSQHRGELSGTGGYRINFCPDVGIYPREPVLNFYTSRKNLRLTQGSYAMAVKTEKQFSSYGHSAGGQGHSNAGSAVHALLSAAGLREECFTFPMRISQALSQATASLSFSLLTSQKGRHLISSLITWPNEMSAANAQVFNCCWNACRCQWSLRQGNHHSQQP